MRNVIIYDDFYKDPDTIRKWALDASILPVENKTYPGIMTETFLPVEVPELFRSLVGTDIYYRNESKVGWFGEFRISQYQDEFEQWIHADPTSPWAGIIFMNPDPPKSYGTAFWKHKKTGTTKAPMKHCRSHPEYDTEAIQKMGYKDWNEVRSELICKDGLDESKWEQTLFIPGVYNRLVLFNSQLWHSHMPKENFGDSKENARMVQLFFFGSKA